MYKNKYILFFNVNIYLPLFTDFKTLGGMQLICVYISSLNERLITVYASVLKSKGIDIGPQIVLIKEHYQWYMPIIG